MARHVVDYLVEEVLLRQAEEVQDFLMQTCVLMSLIAAFRGNLARLFGDHERCVPLAQQALELMSEAGKMPLIRMFRPSTLVTAANTPI